MGKSSAATPKGANRGGRVLILGGMGKIGRSIAADILAHTNAQVILTGRNSRGSTSPRSPLGVRSRFLCLDLKETSRLDPLVESVDLVIHCAGPFHDRDPQVLQTCIQRGTAYLDVADNPDFVQHCLNLGETAAAAGVTAVVSTGIFPGISNSMVRLGIEALDQAESVHLSYVVAGSGGAGPTVMRTTFLELSHSFKGWLRGQWQTVRPYSEPEIIRFSAPYGPQRVYWFSTSEAVTLPRSFPQLHTVITKFGSLPSFYNTLTGWMAQLPAPLLGHPWTIASLSTVSYKMTQLTDLYTGLGVAMVAQVQGQRQGQPTTATVTFSHPQMIRTVGAGTGSLAQLILTGQWSKPGVWPVEQAIPSELFLKTLHQRQLPVTVTCTPGLHPPLHSS